MYADAECSNQGCLFEKTPASVLAAGEKSNSPSQQAVVGPKDAGPTSLWPLATACLMICLAITGRVNHVDGVAFTQMTLIQKDPIP